MLQFDRNASSRVKSTIIVRTCLATIAAATLVAVPYDVRAAVSLYPRELYGGMNVVTVNASTGVQRLQWYDGRRWIDLRKGQALENLRIVSAPVPKRCARVMKLYLFVPDVTTDAEIELRVVECGGGERRLRLETGELWNVDHQQMGAVRVGQTLCQPFSVRSTGSGSVVVDRVVSPSGSFQLRFPAARPPLRILAGRTYSYQVCFRATEPGTFKMPIHVYIRREQPAGGFTSFIVADTAYVTVVGPPPARRPAATTRPTRPAVRPSRPTPPRVRINPPRVIEPVIPAPPPPRRVPDVGTISARATARAVLPLRTEELRLASDVGEPLPVAPAVIDPTTFRTILVPTARSVGEGRAFVASYDVAGIVAGYGVSDRLTLLVGGVYIPEIVADRAIDVTAGGRYEFHRGDFTRFAGGLQLNYSTTDSSSIALVAPYVVASLGDDDHRASVALAYTVRRHAPVAGASFERQALVVTLGGDARIAERWKVAGEAYLIENIGQSIATPMEPAIDDADFAGAAATVRYFGERFAVDVGAIVGGGRAGIGVAPVVSFVWVFGEDGAVP